MKDEFADLNRSFQEKLPTPYCTTDIGFYNLTAFWPTPCKDLPALARDKPDLGAFYVIIVALFVLTANSGPKVYAASPDVTGVGSTPLHLDATSAVNVMTYSSSSLGAEWVIYLRRHTAVLATELRKQFPQFGLEEDPIHSRKLFITRELEQKIFESTGIRPIRFFQHVGEAVYIPAGCAHQVRTHPPGNICLILLFVYAGF